MNCERYRIKMLQSSAAGDASVGRLFGAEVMNLPTTQAINDSQGWQQMRRKKYYNSVENNSRSNESPHYSGRKMIHRAANIGT